VSTIRDIARRAGVSVSTASLALNNDQRVRPETRARILDAAEALNYHPLRAARSLSSGRTWSIQLINPVTDTALSSGFFTRFARGIHDTARENHYSVALSILDDEVEAQDVLNRLMLERWADGVIVMNPSEHDGLLARLADKGFPHVLLGRSSAGGVSSVDNDNHMVAFDATTHLLQAGLGPVLFLNGPSHHTFTYDRAEGYRDAHQATGKELRDAFILSIAGTADAARRTVSERLNGGPEFRSILAISDAQALGAMRAVQEAGFRVPDDVAIIGMNNDDVTEYTFPRLSSIELNAYRLGQSAAEILIQTIDGVLSGPERRIIPHHLVVRESSAHQQTVPHLDLRRVHP
jgi:DNA-binding LacI/PurR family transcriptional regulator